MTRRRWPVVVVAAIAVFGLPLGGVASALPPNCTVPGDFATIQAAVDDPTCVTISVAAGVYNESVVIGRAVTLVGDPGDGAAGPGPSAPVLDGTGLGGFKSAISISAGVSGVVIQGFEIRNYGPAESTAANGVVAWNSGTSDVTVRDNYFHHLGYAAILIGNGWGTPQGNHVGWQITHNRVEDIDVYGFDIENATNTVVNDNVMARVQWTAINVLALATESGAALVSENNDVRRNSITGGADRGIQLLAWTSGGTAATLRNVTVSGNVVAGNFNLLAVWKMGTGTAVQDFQIDDNAFTATNPHSANYLVDLSDVGGTSRFSGNALTLNGVVGSGGSFFHGINLGGSSTGGWTIANNQLVGNNVGSLSVGLRLRGSLPATSSIDASCNNVGGFRNGLQADALAIGLLAQLDSNIIAGNTNSGVTNGAGAAINAAGNWWGDASGPFHPTLNPTGLGDAVSDNVVFDPWLTRSPFCATVGLGRIIVDKVTLPTGSPELFEFVPSWGGVFSLADGSEPHESDPLVPDTYSVSEVTRDGWASSAVCVGEDVTGAPVGEDPDGIVLGAGETVTCTFTNQGYGNIVVEKVTDPVDAAGVFEFDPSWGGNFTLSGGESHDSGPLNAGIYSVAEVAMPAGWSAGPVTCGDGSSPAAIGVSPGETVVCTFTNLLAQAPSSSLTISKAAEPADGTGFDFSGDVGPFSLVSGASETFGDLEPGEYTVTEALPNGWTLEDIVCTTSLAVAAVDYEVVGESVSVNLRQGEAVSCTFYNFGEEEEEATIIIAKEARALPGDTTEFQFTGDLGAFGLLDGASESFTVEPGTYAVTESLVDPWMLDGITCTAGGVADPASASAAITVEDGDEVTCTFRNYDSDAFGPAGSLTILKVTDPAGGTGFEFDAGDLGAFTLDDGDSKLFTDLDSGTYTVTEAAAEGWEVSEIVCTAADYEVTGASVTVNLAEGEAAVCTFSNGGELPYTGSSAWLPILLGGLATVVLGLGVWVSSLMKGAKA